MPRSRNRGDVHPELPAGWPRPGSSGLDPMENYSNAGRFIGTVMSRAASRPLRARGSVSASAFLTSGALLLTFTLLVVISIFSHPIGNGAGTGIIIGLLFCLTYLSVILLSAGSTWFYKHLHRTEKRHPHRGPGSPH